MMIDKYENFTLEFLNDRKEILKVLLSRPKGNAMNLRFFEELNSIIRRASSDEKIRVIVIASSLEKYFTVGLDLQQISIDFNSTNQDSVEEKDAARQALDFLEKGPIKMMQQALSALEECRKPIIVAINSYCIGGGIDFISAADIRLCSSDSIFSVREVVVGLAADLGTLQRLPKIVGNQSWIRDICLTGRNFNANEALTQGLVSEVLESHTAVLKRALEMANLIASRSPIATLGTKHLLIHARDHSVKEGLEYTQLWNSIMLNTTDVSQSTQAMITKSTPLFSKL